MLLQTADIPARVKEAGWTFDHSAGHRLIVWRYVFNKILEKPVLGWGLHTARILPDRDHGNALERFVDSAFDLQVRFHQWLLRDALRFIAVPLLVAALLRRLLLATQRDRQHTAVRHRIARIQRQV